MRWASVAKRLMSMPISEMIARAPRSLTPGIEVTWCLHLPVDFGDCRIEGIDLSEMKPQQEPVVPGHAAAQSLAQGLL